MRTLAILLAVIALAPSAHAKTTLQAHVKVTPSEAGTARRPAGVRLSVHAKLSAASIVTAFELWNGQGLTFQHGLLPRCSATVFRQRGPRGCPVTAIVGGGSLWGPDSDFDRPSGGGGSLVFFNSRDGRLLSYASVTYPTPVSAVLGDAVTREAPGRWPRRYAWTFPPSFQVPFGNPNMLYELNVSLGSGPKSQYVSSVSCPRRGWAWRVRVHIVNAEGSAAVLRKDGRAPCTKR